MAQTFDADQMVVAADLTSIDLVGSAVVGHLAKHVRRHVLVGQILENLLSALRHIARAGKDECHRSDGLGHHAQRYLVASVAHGLTGHTRVAVVVRWSDVHEGRVVTQCQQP